MSGLAGAPDVAQLNASVAPVPVHAPDMHPTHGAHLLPMHCASFVHQQGTPAAVQVPVGDVTSLQFPEEQVQPVVADVSS